MARKKFERTTRRFQLRRGSDYPQDEHVLEVLEYAKKQKREVELIRNAIELFYALEQGNLDMLYEAFPQYKAAINGTGGNGGGQVDEEKLAERIAERVAMLSGSQYKMESAVQLPLPLPTLPTTSKQLGGFKPLAAPVFEDDDDDQPTIATKVSAGAGLEACQNFMHNLQGLH